jgi:protein-tyrosine phosphatase
MFNHLLKYKKRGGNQMTISSQDEALELLETKIAPRSYTIDYPKELWSEVLPGLWQGGTDDDDVYDQLQKPMITKKEFDLVVTAYSLANPVDWFVKELRFGFYDSDMRDFEPNDLQPIVRMAHAEWKRGQRVLIRCQAGMNRSGLIMALVLIREGYTAEDAINLIRAKRSKHALFNGRFEKWLKEASVEAWRN